MSENIHRLQDTFLEHLKRKKSPVTVFLNNGIRLQGTIVGFDAFCMMLERDGQQQIVYKHAVTTTVPSDAVDLQDKSDTPAPSAAPARRTVIVERKTTRTPMSRPTRIDLGPRR